MKTISSRVVLYSMVLIPMALLAAESPMYRITMEGSAPYYTPFVATVPVGLAVQWDNRTATPHTVTHIDCLTGNSCAFDSGSVSPGNSYSLPSLKAGTYPYYCRLHPIMRGVVTVIQPTVKGNHASIAG